MSSINRMTKIAIKNGFDGQFILALLRHSLFLPFIVIGGTNKNTK